MKPETETELRKRIATLEGMIEQNRELNMAMSEIAALADKRIAELEGALRTCRVKASHISWVSGAYDALEATVARALGE